MANTNPDQGQPEGEGFMDHLQKASDEAIGLIMEMFGMKPEGSTAAGGGKNEGVGTAHFFGDLDSFNATQFQDGVAREWYRTYDSIMAFWSAVHWSEPWIIALCVFHVVMFILAVSTRKHSNVQIAIFCVIMGSVYMAETMNAYAGKNWKSFSKQNYFDKRGLFISTVFSTPLLLIGVVMLFQSLYGSMSLLVKVKRQQLKAQYLESKKAEGGGAGGGEAKKTK